jgi:hypothetical protein
MTMAERMLTTVDNPFDPFFQFDQWLAYDTQAGYFTLEFLARIVRSSPELSEADQEQAVDDGISEIVRENVLGIYRAVEPGDVVSI